MADSTAELLDPRIRRTRQLLQQGLSKLLESKDFDRISVHEIADASTVNRATFYDHYSDKFALLECMVASRFHELLAERQVHFDRTCPSALRMLILTLCDYLVQMQRLDPRRALQPHMESAVIAVMRRILLEGMQHHTTADLPPSKPVAPEMLASTLSWAIYGGIKEWVQSADRGPSEVAADTVLMLVRPIFLASTANTMA